MEDQAGLRGVVMGDEHDGALCIRTTKFCHDVEGVTVG
jgi:hypothetical protein